MKKLRLAVIGLGYWGPNVLRNFQMIPSVNIKYGCDLLEENLRKVRLSYPNIHLTKNYKSILKDKDVDAVSISTPLSTHYTIAKESLLAGKHVLVEKPFTTTLEQASDLISISKKNKLILMVGHTFIYSEAVSKLKSLISSGEMGKIFYYDSTRINLGIFQADTNVIWDLAVHDFSILNHILKNKPKTVTAVGSKIFNKNVIEDAHIFLKYPSNITAHIHVSWVSPVKIRNIIIGGSRKMIVYNDIEPSEKIRIYDKGISFSKSTITPFAPAYRSGDITIPHLKQKEALHNELCHFIDCILNNKRPLTDGETGFNSVAMAMACDRSLLHNQEIQIT